MSNKANNKILIKERIISDFNMEAIECISTRRSIRRFINVPIDFETMIKVVEAGSLAPSSGNVQDWKFIIVDDKELMKKICEHSLNQECLHNASFLVLICSDPEQTEMHYGLRGVRLYSVQNCAAAAQNMLLAAHAMGIGGVWVGAFDEEKMREILSIPKQARPQAILAFGYPDEIPDHKRIKSLSIITYFNGYGSTVRNVHHVLRDYSLDWAARISQARTSMEKFKEKSKIAADSAKKKGGLLLKKYKEKAGKYVRKR